MTPGERVVAKIGTEKEQAVARSLQTRGRRTLGPDTGTGIAPAICISGWFCRRVVFTARLHPFSGILGHQGGPVVARQAIAGGDAQD